MRPRRSSGGLAWGQVVPDHPLHPLLSAAMGSEALLGPEAIELLAKVLRNRAGQHELAFPAGRAVWDARHQLV